jgi:alpha-tubulin suppressor-like RCC1 family protein
MRAHRWIAIACAGAAPFVACLATPPTPLEGTMPPADGGEAGLGSKMDATLNDGASAGPPDAGPAEGGGGDAGGGDAGCHVARSKSVLNDAIAITGGGTYANGGVSHACALRVDGSVVCWGDNGLGQLGVPQQETLRSARPVTVRFPADAGAVKVTTIVAGANSTFAIDSQFHLWAWGANDIGELGIGTIDALAHDTPALVMRPDGLGPLLVTSVAMLATAYTTCAVDTTGSLYCWGNAYGGSLGFNGYDTQGNPIPLDASTGTPLEPPNEQAGGGYVRSGYGGFCFVDNLADRMTCWGTYAAPFVSPNPVDGGRQFIEDNPSAAETITNAGGVLPLLDVNTGANFACALDNNHRVYCQGFPVSAPGPAAPLAFEGGIDRIATGYLHVCGVASADGTVFCQGYDIRGQIGNGAVDSGAFDPYPTPVQTADGGIVRGAFAVSAGLNFSCAIEQGACGPAGGGTVVCWGDNLTGQLGSDAGLAAPVDGTSTVFPFAVPVLAPSDTQ